MASPNDVPRVAEPIAGSGGFVTRAWLDFFLKLASTESQADLAALYAALAARVAELEENEGLSFQIIGQGAISVNGTPQPGGFVVISLENDTDAPGNTMYYGTGPTGLKGWFPISSSVAVTADLTKAVAGTGVTTFGLADLSNSGLGAALVKITRDAKGRVSGTSSATTDDLPQGATNKYFIDAPSDGQTYGRKDGTWVTITGGGIPEAPINGFPYVRMNAAWEQTNGPNSRFFLIEYPLLTDQLGNQLTDQLGNPLMANSPLIPAGWPTITVNTFSTTLPKMTLAQANALVNPEDFQMIAITDLAGGREPCWYDTTVASGTKWRRFSDRSIAN